MKRKFTFKEEIKDVGNLFQRHRVSKNSCRENLLKITDIPSFLARLKLLSGLTKTRKVQSWINFSFLRLTRFQASGIVTMQNKLICCSGYTKWKSEGDGVAGFVTNCCLNQIVWILFNNGRRNTTHFQQATCAFDG